MTNASTHLVTVKTPQVFWGNTSTGQPGPNPADSVGGPCLVSPGGGTNLIDYTGAVPKEFSVGEPALK